MNQIKTKPAQNQAMDCCKMVAAVLVVFNHVRFPGKLDGFLNCLCMFAVPMFFATTGYFNLDATPKQLKRRFWHIAKLNILADMVHIFWRCLYTEMKGGSTIAFLRQAVPDLNELLWWVILHKNSFLGHLWYLVAVATCYLVYLGYVSFFGEKKVDHRPLYFGGFVLFVGYFVLAIVLPVAGIQPGGYYNGWFLGLPMFLMGMFFREYQEQIFENFRLNNKKLLLLLALGVGGSVLQWMVLDLAGAPFGLPLGSAALMLLLIRNPRVADPSSWISRACISKFGTWSTGMYLFHLTLSIAYDSLFYDGLILKYGETAASYLRPLIVLAAAVVFSILWERSCVLLGKLRRKTNMVGK